MKLSGDRDWSKNPDTSAVGEASQAFSSIIQTSYGE